ncbi:MAG: RHS repeat domain-containing protein, partial [Acutalibacteraceae bacterium]
MTQANGGTYSYEYDVLDRVTKITDPEGYFRS